MAAIPRTMRALELRAYDGRSESLALIEKPVPRPAPGEVLVEIAASPINPSDLASIRGSYSVRKPLPVVPGLEASGIVVAAGSGLYPRLLVGKRVACYAGDGDGAWAEYMATPALHCMPLPGPVSLEQGSMAIVNPLTAWCLLTIARRGKHTAVVQTAAASALGKMIARLGQKRRVQVIHIVRRPAQLEMLRTLGTDAELILDSSQPDFDERLSDVCRRRRATLAFDAVAGDMTGRLLNAMPKHGKVIVYGGLSQDECRVDPRCLIFEGKRVEGFWLAQPAPLSRIDFFRAIAAVRRRLHDEYKTDVRLRTPLQAATSSLGDYVAHMSEGKVLIVPSIAP
ncbi:MAG: zinc-binding dehydrogenase [Pseudomonadota bacterium]